MSEILFSKIVATTAVLPEPISDNYGNIPVGRFEEVVVRYLAPTNLTVVFENVDSGIVEFYYNGAKIGEAEVIGNSATIEYVFNDDTGYGNKLVSAKLIKDDYKASELIEGNIYVEKSDVILVVSDVSIYKGSYGTITVKALDKYTNAPVKGVNVVAYYGSKDKLGSAVSDENGVAS